MDKIDFIILNRQCEVAIIESNSIEENTIWLKKFKTLFEKISIKPLDLPSISNQNHNGVIYTHIGNFHSLYIKIKNIQLEN